MIAKRHSIAICLFAMTTFPAAILGAIMAAAHGVRNGDNPEGTISSPPTIRNKRSYRDIMLRYMDKPIDGLVMVDRDQELSPIDVQSMDPAMANLLLEQKPLDSVELADLIMGPYASEAQKRFAEWTPLFSRLDGNQRPLMPFRGKKNGFAAFRGKKSGFSAFRGKKSEGAGNGDDDVYGFSGFRGRRDGFSAFRGKKGAEGFVGFRGKKPAGFMSARGKRFNRNGARSGHNKRAQEEEGDLTLDNNSLDNEMTEENNTDGNNGSFNPALFLKNSDSSEGISSFLHAVKGALVEPDSELHNSDPSMAAASWNRRQRSPLGTNMGFLFATPAPSPRN